jgi:signal transduction histidine kinase
MTITWLTKGWQRLVALSQQNVTRFGAQYDAFVIFIFIFYIANPLKWHFAGPYSFSSIACLRIFAFVFWIFLAFWRKWPAKLKKYLPLYWHFSLFYHLPFRTTFSVLYSSYSPSFDSFGLLGIVALAILVDEKPFCILSILGIICGSIVYFICGGVAIPLVKASTLIYAALMVISIAFIKLIFFHNFNNRLKEKNRSYITLAGAIAHEVRGPLCILNIISNNFQHKNTFSEQEADMIKNQSRLALNVIDSILLQIKYIENSVKIKRKNHVLLTCIHKAINNSNLTNKIKLDIAPHITVSADKQLLEQVFINLIKNSSWAIQKANKEQIIISAKERDRTVEISVFDNGHGIKDFHLKKIFEPFFSANKNGVGLGLAFCKLAIKNMGGSIRCESEEGSYTRFVINLQNAQDKLIARGIELNS